MKLRDLFETWGLTGLKVKLPILEMDFEPGDADRNAAWDLYVELLTRIATQGLPDDHGIEPAALESVYTLFPLTRNTLKQHGRKAVGFTRVAVIVLNQIVRPFTAKWHRLAEQGAFDNADQCNAFRNELRTLQVKLKRYTQLLADLADVEDLTDMEADDTAAK